MNFSSDAFEFDVGEPFVDTSNVTDDYQEFFESCNTRSDESISFSHSWFDPCMSNFIVDKFGIKNFLLGPTGKLNGKLLEAKSYLIYSVDDLDPNIINENSVLYYVTFCPAKPTVVDNVPTIIKNKFGYWIIRVA
jgi:hypothetical protein